MTGRVLVLGNAGVDLSMPLPRLPLAGETLVGGTVQRAPGGKGLNQAVMAARAGAAVLFCAPLGSDADGDFVEATLCAEPLAHLHLPRPGPGTDLSILLVAPDSENCIVTSGACAAALQWQDAEAFVAGARAGDVLLLQGNLDQRVTELAAQAGQARGARVILNTAPLRWAVQDTLAACWGVVANTVEAEQVTGQVPEAAADALAALGPALAIVTLGAQGCVLAGGGHYAAPGVTARDSTGAGDAFCGVLAAALAQGRPPDQAVVAAQRAAADTVTRPGAFAALPARFSL